MHHTMCEFIIITQIRKQWYINKIMSMFTRRGARPAVLPVGIIRFHLITRGIALFRTLRFPRRTFWELTSSCRLPIYEKIMKDIRL